MAADRDPEVVDALTRAAEALEVGPPAYRSRVRSIVARRAVALAVGVVLVGVAVAAVVGLDRGGTTDVATSPTSPTSPTSATTPGASASPPPGELTLNPMTGSFHPGDTIHITGSGCPPTGPDPVRGDSVGVRLGPRGGAPGWAVSNGTISIANNSIYVPGVVNAATTTSVDGTWAVDVVVPTDAPPSDGYTITGSLRDPSHPRHHEPRSRPTIRL